jgi:hypothetical protein
LNDELKRVDELAETVAAYASAHATHQQQQQQSEVVTAVGELLAVDGGEYFYCCPDRTCVFTF